MATLVDTNILVYHVDPREPTKQAIARDVLREGWARKELILPHQAIVEFVAATTRARPSLGGLPLLQLGEAMREAETLLRMFPVLYPDVQVLTGALRGHAAYGLSWFDAHLWSYAETNGIEEILSEDFEHGRHYGHVRVRDPFKEASGVHEPLPPLYD